MTFRELLQKANHKEIFNHLYREYYYKNIDDEVHEMARSYQKVMDQLLQKPSRPNKEWEIQVRTSEGAFDDICWYNIEEEAVYALDLTPWSEIIDANIQDPLDLPMNEACAHILYEITFYGFTEEQIVAERQALKKLSAEVGDGTARLEWEEIEQEVDELTNED